MHINILISKTNIKRFASSASSPDENLVMVQPPSSGNVQRAITPLHSRSARSCSQLSVVRERASRVSRNFWSFISSLSLTTTTSFILLRFPRSSHYFLTSNIYLWSNFSKSVVQNDNKFRNFLNYNFIW